MAIAARVIFSAPIWLDLLSYTKVLLIGAVKIIFTQVWCFAGKILIVYIEGYKIQIQYRW